MNSQTYLRELQSRLVRRLEEQLGQLGFLRDEQLFLRTADNGVVQMVHLNLGVDRRSKQATAIVSVAVRHEKVEQLVMGWRSDLSAREKQHVATVGQEIGVISNGRTKVWTFRGPSEADSAAREIVSEIQKVGLPYLAKFSDLTAVAEALEAEDLLRHGQYPGGRAQRLPVVKALLEGADAARGVFRDQFRHLREVGDPIATEYRDFVRFVAPRLGLTGPIDDFLDA